MENNLTTIPLLLPIIGFCLTLLLSNHKIAKHLVSIVIASSYTLFCLWYLFFQSTFEKITLNAGGWSAPFGISLVLDSFSGLMLLASGLIYTAVLIYMRQGANSEDSPLLFPICHSLMLGVSGAFLTSDLFNLYVWFEVILLSSFVLLNLQKSKLRTAGTFKYIALNILSSLLFLFAAGLVYNTTKVLDFDAISTQLKLLYPQNPAYITFLGMLLFIAFSVKAAIFPFYFWLPASYPHLSSSLGALFAGILTKVGLYAIFKVCLIVFPAGSYIQNSILILASLTMVLGVFGAIIQQNIGRILSFHIISQVGYIAIAGALVANMDKQQQVIGLTVALFYMVHHMIVKANLFLVAGVIKSKYGTDHLEKLGGLRVSDPLFALLFAIPALSLAGLPPSSGFWAKFLLIRESLAQELNLAVLVMIAAGILTLFSMAKIWIGAFWGVAPEAIDKAKQDSITKIQLGRREIFACSLLAVASLIIGIYPDPVYEKSKVASSELITIGASK